QANDLPNGARRDTAKHADHHDEHDEHVQRFELHVPIRREAPEQFVGPSALLRVRAAAAWPPPSPSPYRHATERRWSELLPGRSRGFRQRRADAGGTLR